ncbi:carboxypeptidase-like regulatory domain-containing protein [Mucilaginibacter sp. dw_454]|uniref:carboxypeptidase-like regulatory domain-containing protein n=1 Tax=Mucilaginibacter sp. dw_454 TaxID=2720079 RepID=UPI001BD43EA2|nr:carboxypeptidase-like regulatory domain-containing protein [Mucilaginibacter sp. dw_454]
MRKLLPLLVLATLTTHVLAQQTQRALKKTTINKLFTCSLDLMFDTLSKDYNLKIVFERDSVSRYHVVDHFLNESLGHVLDEVCGNNKLHYWIEADGTIYILKNMDDLSRLKKMYALASAGQGANLKRIAPPEAPPKNFDFSISGKVVDQTTGESVRSATIRVMGTNLTATTGADGQFVFFNIPSDTCVIETSYSGFQTDRFRLTAQTIKLPITIPLYPSLNTLNEVSILGKKSGVMNTDAKKVGVLQLTPAALDKLPVMGEKDVLKAFQLMPGVSGTNESSSGAYVRGGTPDQNLVVFDGFTVYQVDHLYGFFSAFNANAVKDVQLYKGGFSSKYGGRLSSVTEITGKDGNTKQSIFGVDLSLLSFNAFLETPVTDNSSLLVAVRRSYQGPFYDKIFKQFNATTVPGGGGGGGFGGRRGGGGFGEQVTPASHFYDVDFRYTYKINADNTIAWSFYAGDDNTDNSRDLPTFFTSTITDGKITDYTKYGNTASSIKWSSTWSKNLHSNTYITYSSYFNDRNRGTSGTNTDDGVSTTFDNGTNETNNLKDIGIKSEWEWQLNNTVKLSYGGFANHQQVNYQYVQNDTSKLIDQHDKAFLGGGYVELELDPTGKLHLQPGVRETWFQPTGKLYTEPRFSASYTLDSHYTLKFATGQFYQFMNQVTREDLLNGNRNFWVISDGSTVPVGMARHYMGGASYENDQFLIDVEGYYKTLDGLTQYTIGQQGGGGFGPGGGTATLQQNFYTGTGNAKGIEVLVQKKLGLYTGWLSYTLSQTQNKFAVYGNTYYPADQDVTNEFKSINMYHYDRWNFAAVFLFSTGHPYTAPLSSYTVTGTDGNRITAFNVGAKNGERLPDYHRLDLSATYDLLKINGNKIGSIGVSLFNVYNHKNIWYREYQFQDNQVITTDVTYLGFTPNLTLSLRWK